MKKYTLTDEHRAQLEPWAQRWIANALSTKAMDDDDRARTVEAIEGLYRAANLEPPPRHRIVFVPSPLMARVVAGFAAAIWHMRQTHASTHAATSAATFAATSAATDAATHAATSAATYAATRVSTDAATYDATDAATDVATSAATDDATADVSKWWAYPASVMDLARAIVPTAPVFAAKCASMAWRMHNGGNQWSGWVAYLAFFRHVVKLPIDYSKWQHYEDAAVHAGPRYMHKQFCIVSDRPEILTRDANARPHNESGPFCRWRDGFELYAWHGVYVPAWVIRHPERITIDAINAEDNAEVRRAMIERRGWDWYLDAIGATPVQSDGYGDLYRTTIDDADVGIVVVTNSTPELDGTHKRYALLVPPTHKTAHAAVADTFGLTPDTYQPAYQT